jgi:hypothetical protein
MKPTIPCALLLATFLLTAFAVSDGQDQGRWTAHFLPDKSVYITLQSGGDNQKGLSNHSMTLPESRLQDANFAPGTSSSNAHFSLRTEAGTVTFNGVVNGDTGAGDYVFAPDPGFPKKMKQLGFTIAPEQQLLFALNNVTVDYARSMRDATEVKEPGRLLKMARLRIDSDFAARLSKAFGEKLEAEEVIEAAKHKVTPEYIASIHKLLPRAEFDDIGRLQRRAVSVEFISEARKCRPDITAEQIEELKNKHGSPCTGIE